MILYPGGASPPRRRRRDLAACERTPYILSNALNGGYQSQAAARVPTAVHARAVACQEKVGRYLVVSTTRGEVVTNVADKGSFAEKSVAGAGGARCKEN